MVTALVGVGSTLVSMTLMTVSARLRLSDCAYAARLYDVAFRFGVLAALFCLGVVSLKLLALLNDQPVGRITLLGLFGVLAFKVWVVQVARKARNTLRQA